MLNVSNVLETLGDAVQKAKDHANEKGLSKSTIASKLAGMGIEVPLVDVEIKVSRL